MGRQVKLQLSNYLGDGDMCMEEEKILRFLNRVCPDTEQNIHSFLFWLALFYELRNMMLR